MPNFSGFGEFIHRIFEIVYNFIQRELWITIFLLLLKFQRLSLSSTNFNTWLSTNFANKIFILGQKALKPRISHISPFFARFFRYIVLFLYITANLYPHRYYTPFCAFLTAVNLTFLRIGLKLSLIDLLYHEERKMKTTKLYQKDVYIKKWKTTITKTDGNNLYLEESAFFPEGGGQSCDTGRISLAGDDPSIAVDITDVQEEGDTVVHTVSNGSLLQAGDTVECTLDWDRRFDNMQRHCGEHILSGIFYQECGGVNRGFHMGEDYMTIDIKLEDEPTGPEAVKVSEINMETALRCELLANKVIWSDAPVTVLRFDSREEAERMPLRKKLAFDEDISIVCIGSVENAADCVACCGTHPNTSGQVGLIKLYKVEKYKDMFRIYFEAGRRALRNYDFQHDMLTELSNRYSSSIEDFPKKIRSQETHLASVKNDLFQLKKALTDIESDRLDTSISETESNVVLFRLEHFTADDAFHMAKAYMGQDRTGGKLLLLYSVPATAFVLVSNGNFKCGKLVREYADFYRGKGGGNDVSARAMFGAEEDAMLFADLLRKHLQGF